MLQIQMGRKPARGSKMTINMTGFSDNETKKSSFIPAEQHTKFFIHYTFIQFIHEICV